PAKTEESREKRVMNSSRLRDSVTRDVSWLLNCVWREADQDLSAYPEVQRSVLNFGIPDLTGVAVSSVDAASLQRQIREAIANFEPRLHAETLLVNVEAEGSRMDSRALRFRIESEMWAQPIPLNLYLKTEVDLETGKFSVSERSG